MTMILGIVAIMVVGIFVLSAPTTKKLITSPLKQSTVAYVTPTATDSQLLSVTPSQSDNASFDKFQYPNSKKIDTTQPPHFESNDSSEKITEWYKNKIRNQGMNISSFISSNSNGNIQNRLSASGNNHQINVTISKSNISSIVMISVKTSQTRS